MISEEESDRQANEREFSLRGKEDAKERDAADANRQAKLQDAFRIGAPFAPEKGDPVPVSEETWTNVKAVNSEELAWPRSPLTPEEEAACDAANAEAEASVSYTAHRMPPRPTVEAAMQELMREYGLGVLAGCAEEEVAGLGDNDRAHVGVVMKLAACKAIKELRQMNEVRT